MSVNDIIGSILAIIVLVGIPLLVTILFVMWINPITVLEKLVMMIVGTMVFFVVLFIDLCVIMVFND